MMLVGVLNAFSEDNPIVRQGAPIKKILPQIMRFFWLLPESTPYKPYKLEKYVIHLLSASVSKYI